MTIMQLTNNNLTGQSFKQLNVTGNITKLVNI